MNQCVATRANGGPCNARALPSRPMCWAHDPTTREKAGEARRRGGENKSTIARVTRRMPRDLNDLGRRLLEAFEAVNSGEIPPDRAHAMARLAAVYVQIHSAAEVDARLEALEQAAAGGKGTGGPMSVKLVRPE